MKKLILAALISTSSFAMTGIPNVPSDFPTESGWAKFKVSNACNMEFDSSDVGMIDETDNGRLFTITDADGNEIAAAIKPGFFAKTECI